MTCRSVSGIIVSIAARGQDILRVDWLLEAGTISEK